MRRPRMKCASPLDYQEQMAVAEDEQASASLAALAATPDSRVRAGIMTKARASAEQAAFHRWLARRLRALGFRK